MRKTIEIKNLKIGGGNKVSVQSMTNTDTNDYESTFNQIQSLIEVGCDAVRLAVTDLKEIETCKRYVKNFSIPLIADIQFDYRLAIAAADAGFAKVRFNPGNIGSESKVQELVEACKQNHTAIRVGVNYGSLEQELKSKDCSAAEKLVSSALKHVLLLEKFSFYDTVISVKASDVKVTVDAYRLLYNKCDYPLHIGITETGDKESGIIKSAAGLGALLLDGIGDTMRVSLTASPVEEVYAAKSILRAVGLEKNYCQIISCPTCARCKYNLFDIVQSVKDLTINVTKPLKIAVMGCVVNGPGEAEDADFGIAGGSDSAVLFKNGKVFKKININDAEKELKILIEEYTR